MAHALRSNVEKLEDDTICLLCDELLDVFLEQIRSDSISMEDMQDVLMGLCTSLFYEDEEVCYRAISSNIVSMIESDHRVYYISSI